jgi:antitoxin CcdA
MRMPAARPRKAPTNLSVRVDLVKRARELGLNISELVDAALERAIKDAERAAWLEENREAIDAHNRWYRKHGLWSDGLRKF